MFELEGKVAIVTGGGRGIGRAIALGLAQAQCDVVVAARTEADIEAVCDEVRKKGRKALAVPTDVRKEEEVKDLVQRTVEEWGRMDALVNNAGGSFVVESLAMSEGGFDAIIRENLKSTFLCSREAGKVMRQQKKGVIVSIASIAGIRAYPLCVAYGAAKAGIINLTQTLALDLAPYEVRVNAIAPGFMATEGFLKLLGGEGPNKETSPITQNIPLGRLGDPGDIAGLVVYLISDAASYITGQTIVVDGGMTIPLPFSWHAESPGS